MINKKYTGIKNALFLCFVLLVILSSCNKDSNALKVENTFIIYFAGIDKEKDIPVTLFPNIFNDSIKSDIVQIGNIKDGKLNISLPNHLDNSYLYNPEDLEYIVPKGLKIAVFHVNPALYLINDDTDMVEMSYLIYSNKKGKMIRYGEENEIFVKKGWNIFTLSNEGLEIFDYVDLQKRGYNWIFYDRYEEFE